MKRLVSGYSVVIGLWLFIVLFCTGCATFGWKSAHEKQLETETEQLKDRLSQADHARQELLAQLDKERADFRRIQEERVRHIKVQKATQEKVQESQELLRAQEQLTENLDKELKDAHATLEMTKRGLVLTFLDEIFFDSGHAEIKPEGLQTLQKVGPVLKETVPDSFIAVEGHTDNDPIKHSGWKSNWELSTARAQAVLNYFVNGEGITPIRLRVVGCGEYQPVASNETKEGRRQNRRVEIVILPKNFQKVKPGTG